MLAEVAPKPWPVPIFESENGYFTRAVDNYVSPRFYVFKWIIEEYANESDMEFHTGVEIVSPLVTVSMKELRQIAGRPEPLPRYEHYMGMCCNLNMLALALDAFGDGRHKIAAGSKWPIGKPTWLRIQDDNGTFVYVEAVC